MIVEATFWDDAILRIRAAGADVPWNPRIDWEVGDAVVPESREVHECVFEPRCLRLGEPCVCPIGARPHVVYAAFYGTLAKIGMTASRRLEQRLREQGADAGFVVARCSTRAEARRAEKDISFMQGIPQWRTRQEKLPQLTRPVPWERVDERMDELRSRLSHHFEPSSNTIRIEHPVPVLPRRPHAVETAGVHRGEVLGAKGTYLFYRPDGMDGRLPLEQRPVLALKHTDLVGRGFRSLPLN